MPIQIKALYEVTQLKKKVFKNFRFEILDRDGLYSCIIFVKKLPENGFNKNF